MAKKMTLKEFREKYPDEIDPKITGLVKIVVIIIGAIIILFCGCTAPHAFIEGKEVHDVCSEKGRYVRMSGRWIYKGSCVMKDTNIVIWQRTKN